MTWTFSRRAFTAAGAAALTCGAAHAQAPSAKLALIIANSDYDGDGKVDSSSEAVMRAQARGFVGDLPNPWFDAVRVGEAFKGAGFSVDTVFNGDRASMYGAVSRLYARARATPGAATVIYYAGHGVQLGGHSYLVATRARLTPEDMVAETGIDRTRIGLAMGMQVQDILMQAPRPTAPGYNLILLDACRDNPWEPQIRAAQAAQGRDYVGERGFMGMSVMTPRTVLTFSAQGGQGARDGIAAAGSPFANALVGRMRRGETIDAALSGMIGQVSAMSGALQSPWVSGRLGDGTAF
jgi:hypothetical protein